MRDILVTIDLQSIAHGIKDDYLIVKFEMRLENLRWQKPIKTRR